jgi:hypothetical protein
MTTLKEELDEVSMLDDRDFRYNREIYEVVKRKVLQFEKYLYDDRSLKETCEKRFKEIFGDFQK